MEDQVHIRSQVRTSNSTSSDDFRIELASNIEGQYQLISAVVPNTHYNIPSGRETIHFFDGGANRTGSVVVGNYTSSTIAAAVKTAMDAVGAQAYTVTYSDVTKKLTVSAAGAFYFRWGDDANDSCYRQLGFNKADTASGTSVVSPNIIDLSATKLIHVDLYEASNRVVDAQSENSPGALTLPCNVAHGSYVFFNQHQNSTQIVNVRRTKQINIRLRTDGDERFNLNGVNCEFVFRKL